MKERIYTIPVNEAFDHPDGCPFCKLYAKLENDELDIILGASMMEPEIRIATNEQGFCNRHYHRMFEMKNRLGLGLMLESHLGALKKELSAGNVFSRDIAAKSVSRVERLEKDCYVCGRIASKIGKMFETAAYLYDEERDFRGKFDEVKYFCLPHYKMYLEAGRGVLGKESYNAFAKAVIAKNSGYLATLSEEVSWFCKKFDYRYEAEPWGNSRDSVERAIRFLGGENALPQSKK